MDIRHAVEVVGLAVDAVGVAVIVVAIGIAGVAFARGLGRGLPFEASYRTLRQSIGHGILLGLELLVAGDIIRTVAIAPTFTSVGVLAGIVLIRTFLSFSLEVRADRTLAVAGAGRPATIGSGGNQRRLTPWGGARGDVTGPVPTLAPPLLHRSSIRAAPSGMRQLCRLPAGEVAEQLMR